MHNNALYCNSMGNLPFYLGNGFQHISNTSFTNRKHHHYRLFGNSVSMVVMMVQGSMLLGVGAFLTLIGVMDSRMAGNLIIAKFIGALAIRPTVMIVMSWSQIISAREALKELRYFLKTAEIVTPSRISLPPPKGELAVSNVSLLVGKAEKKILDSISFSLKPGTICAVLGESGSGKSSLARILIGFNQPTKGSVRLDGVEIANWNKNELCDHIGYVPQDLQIFGGDIVTNITRFKEVDEEKLEKFVMNSVFVTYLSFTKRINQLC